MNNDKVKSITITGMFAALVFLATMLHAPIGVNGGYIHFGDALVYLSASMLPMPFAMIASAVGAGLSDLLSPGAAVWALPTVIIKALCCLPFTNKGVKLLCGRNVLGTLIAAAISITGYLFATAIIAGGFMTAVAEIPFSLIQSGGSAAVYLVLAAALDKTMLKQAITFTGVKQ